ncbi:sigma-70 family RNA polymerase sigma factor [Bacteroidales bacterium OttesenSCG-928-I14]|nr:sigma-70 family RNA polymerase sigma factor [Bacteroidales bacterium OttesenSCG-928-I14]
MNSVRSDLDQIVSGCKKKDKLAQRKLYDLFASKMFGICVRYVHERETARDILQEGFIKVYTKIDSYSGSGSFEGWMKTVFVTTALEYLRSNKSFRFTEEITDYNEAIEDTAMAIIPKLSAEEILRCVQELPTGFKTVFNLYAIEGYSHSEIAEMLNIKEASSRSQFARARQLLQTKIKELYR